MNVENGTVVFLGKEDSHLTTFPVVENHHMEGGAAYAVSVKGNFLDVEVHNFNFVSSSRLLMAGGEFSRPVVFFREARRPRS